jgi:hypothetical protein
MKKLIIGLIILIPLFLQAQHYPVIKPSRVTYSAKYVIGAAAINNGAIGTLLAGRGTNITTIIEEIVFKYQPGTSPFTVGSGTDSTFVYTTFNGVRQNMFHLTDSLFTATGPKKPIVMQYSGGIDENADIKIDFADKLQNGAGCKLTIIIYYKIDEN